MRIVIETNKGLIDNVLCDDPSSTVILMDHDTEEYNRLVISGGQDAIDEVLKIWEIPRI